MSLIWHPPETTRGRAERKGYAFRPAPQRFGNGAFQHARIAAFVVAARRFFGRRPVLFFAVLTLLASGLFFAFPGIDMATTRWFMSKGDFTLSRIAMLVHLRDLNRMLPPILLVPVAAMYLAQAFVRRFDWMMRPHKTLFILLFYAIGPGLVVNGLKMTMGRPRPLHVVDFGGTLPFSPAWEYSTACLRNCSFTSGEAGSAVAMIAFVLVMSKRWRPVGLIFIVPLAIAFSVNRIAFGAHFLSDTVLSWLLCALVMSALWPRFKAAGPRIDAILTGSGAPAVEWLRRRLAAGRRDPGREPEWDGIRTEHATARRAGFPRRQQLL